MVVESSLSLSSVPGSSIKRNITEGKVIKAVDVRAKYKNKTSCDNEISH